MIYLTYLSTVDHLDHNLPLWIVVQDLYSTGPTQEICSTVNHSDFTAPTRIHELDHTNHTDHTGQEYIIYVS